MAIDWKKFETVFRLLAAVYAALGEEAFKGKFRQIAALFGKDASYDAIKSEWRKVAQLSADLWRERRRCHPQVGTNRVAGPRGRQLPQRENIKSETHGTFIVDHLEEFRASPLASTGVKKTPISDQVSRKRKLDSDDAPAEPGAGGRSEIKRARLEPTLQPSVHRNGTIRSPSEENPHGMPTYSDDVFELIRKAISPTPVNRPTTDSHTVTSPPNIILIPSTSEPAAPIQVGRPPAIGGLSKPFELRELSQCQVSTTEHDRRDWETRQRRLQQAFSTAKVEPQALRDNPGTGPSRVRADRHLKTHQERRRALDVISISSSDENENPRGNANNGAHIEASTRPNKGKARMKTPPATLANQDAIYPMPAIVSYINPKYGICYLCGVAFLTDKELRVHERGEYHSQQLTVDDSLEKAQGRLEKYGLFQQFCSRTDEHVTDLPTVGNGDSTPREARTIIRGLDRAVDLLDEGGEMDRSSSQDVVEVSRTESSAYRNPGKSTYYDLCTSIENLADPAHRVDTGTSRVRRLLTTIVKKAKEGTYAKSSKGPKIVIGNPKQMARILHFNRFSRSNTVDRVLTLLERVLSGRHTTAPKCFHQFSSPAQPQFPPSHTTPNAGNRISKTHSRPNLWIADAEFASLKGPGNRYDLSVNITNLISGETIINHRLELAIPVDELEKKIRGSRNWQARHQFVVHHRQPCSMPIITPVELAHMLRNGGFGPRDFVFVWASSNVDYNVVNDFLARQGLQHGLMPPEANVVRVLYAWKELLPGVSCRLDKLFELVFPDCHLRYVHHFADVDTKKLGLMTWKLRDLPYGINGQQTQFHLFA